MNQIDSLPFKLTEKSKKTSTKRRPYVKMSNDKEDNWTRTVRIVSRLKKENSSLFSSYRLLKSIV